MSTPEPPDGPLADAGRVAAPPHTDVRPWDEGLSSYERAKHATTLEACGPGPFERALELGTGHGLFSGGLAERCAALVTIDSSPGAVELAREHLGAHSNVTVVLGTIPDDLPTDDGFDLIVASEILYYLSDDDFRRTVDRLPRLLRPDGRLVAVHWSGQAPDLARSAVQTHRALRVGSGLRPVQLPPPPGRRAYLLDAFDMR